jgi:hypothetical protein
MVLNSALTQIIAEDRRDLLLVVQVKEGRIVFIPAIRILICIIICYLLKITCKSFFAERLITYQFLSFLDFILTASQCCVSIHTSAVTVS